jgi:dynein light chain Tctex-type 1
VPNWINIICDSTLKKLIEYGRPYKYMVNCTIMQRNGAGVQVASSCFWDAVIDNFAVITWPKEKGSKQE